MGTRTKIENSNNKNRRRAKYFGNIAALGVLRIGGTRPSATVKRLG